MPPRTLATLLACLIAALAATPAAQAAIGTPVDLGSAETNAGSNLSIDITTSASAPAGASIIVTSLVTGSPAPGAVTCSDSAGNAYATDASMAASTAITAICSTHQIAAALPSGSTVTVTGGGASPSYRVRAFAVTGLAAPALDRTASAEATSSAPSSGAAVATVQPDELLVGAITNRDHSVGDAGFAPGTNGTANNCAATSTPTYAALAAVGTVAHSLFTIHCTVNATGSYVAQGTFGGSADWQAVLATYRAAASAPPVNQPTPVPAQPAGSPDCSKLRAKLRRQKRKLKGAVSEAKRSAIARNIEDTRERLRRRGC